jgi:predicted deacylase
MVRRATSVDRERGPFQIANLVCEVGETARGALDVAHTLEGPLSIPILIVHGARPGPIVGVDAGIHGDEYDGMEAVRRLAATVDPMTLGGTIVAIPCVNVVAFESASRESRIDGGNLNRVFPGSTRGTITERIAAAFLREVVARVDVLVDLHTGGTFGEITPLTIVQRGHEDLVLDLGRAAGHEYLWLGGDWAGTARLAALQAGRRAVTIEAGGGTCQDRVVTMLVESVRNILRHLEMLPGAPTYRDEYSLVTGSFTRSSCGGFFHPDTAPGEQVRRGQRLGTIIDHFGGVVEVFDAPADGIVLWMRRLRTILPGQEVVIFGEPAGTVR